MIRILFGNKIIVGYREEKRGIVEKSHFERKLYFVRGHVLGHAYRQGEKVVRKG